MYYFHPPFTGTQIISYCRGIRRGGIPQSAGILQNDGWWVYEQVSTFELWSHCDVGTNVCSIFRNTLY